MDSILKNKTLTLPDPPPERKIIGCKWVFMEKIDGEVVKYKARICAEGCGQLKGIYCNDTFSPVVRLSKIIILFGFVAQRDLDIYHYDVYLAFLQGELKEVIYMRQPEGYTKKGQEGKVCKLNKALIGLKQGSKAWNSKLNKKLRKIGLIRSLVDQCIYHYIRANKYYILAVFVDDIILY